METTGPRTHDCPQESTGAPGMGRLTFGDMSRELPIDDDHKANREVLGVFGRELKKTATQTPAFTFQALADQVGCADRRNVHNFHREFSACDADVQTVVTRKAVTYDRLFPLIEASVLETPLLSPHEQDVSFGEAHPTESLSEHTFRNDANAMDGLQILNRVRQLVRAGTATVDMSRYLAEVLASERLSRARKKEIVEMCPEVEAAACPPTTGPVEVSRPTTQKRLLVVSWIVEKSLPPFF